MFVSPALIVRVQRQTLHALQREGAVRRGPTDPHKLHRADFLVIL